MKNEVLLALVLKEVEERFESLSADTSRFRGPKGYRGEQGPKGEDGKPFSIEEHSETIKSWVKEFSLKFQDLTESEIEQLRGPNGKDGRDGKSFIFSENEDSIRAIVSDEIASIKSELSLKFQDLTESEIEELRGPRGRDGRDGKSLTFEDLEESQKEEFKLRFSDLSVEDIYKLKLKFSDLSEDEISALKLKFSDLTEDDKLTLRGSRGQRGKQGATGNSGDSAYELAVRKGFVGSESDWIDSLRGPQGLRGEKGDSIVGARGEIGPKGPKGNSGKDGEDAPFVTDVQVVQEKEFVHFIFEFSDGSELKTNEFKLPSQTITYSPVYGAGSSGGGSGGGGSTFQYLFGSGVPSNGLGLDGDLYQDTATGDQYKKIAGAWVLQDNLTGPQGPAGAAGADGADGDSAYEVAVANGFVGTEAQWLASLVGPQGPQGIPGTGGTQLLENVVCDSSVYVGAVVRLTKDNEVASVMDDWTLLAAITQISYTEYDVVAYNSQANSYGTALSSGIAIAKPTATTCDIVLAGDTGEVFLGLDVTREYFLSASIPGRIVASFEVPNNPAHVYIRLGRAISGKRLFVDIGERILRA